MRPAIALWNIVGEAEHILMIGICPFQSRFNSNAVFLTRHKNRFRDESILGFVQVLNKGRDAACIFQNGLVRLSFAQIFEDDFDARVQECELTQTVLERLAIIDRHGEGLRARKEAHSRAGIGRAVFCRWACANHFQRRFCAAAIDKADMVFRAITVNGEIQPN